MGQKQAYKDRLELYQIAADIAMRWRDVKHKSNSNQHARNLWILKETSKPDTECGYYNNQ